jgi:hypothetical protein
MSKYKTENRGEKEREKKAYLAAVAHLDSPAAAQGTTQHTSPTPSPHSGPVQPKYRFGQIRSETKSSSSSSQPTTPR